MNLIKLINDIKKYGLTVPFRRYYSFYEGSVVDNKDPENLGRLKIKCPKVYGDKSPNKWVFPKGIIGGNKHGLSWLPNEGDPIYISFREGDVNFPVWEYGWTLSNQNTPNTEIGKYSLVTPNGNRIDLNDNNNDIIITQKDGLAVKIDNKTISFNGDSLGGIVDAKELKTQLDKNSNSIDKIFDAINNGVPVPQDGGAGLQTTMKAIISGSVSGNFSNIQNKTVTHGN